MSLFIAATNSSYASSELAEICISLSVISLPVKVPQAEIMKGLAQKSAALDEG